MADDGPPLLRPRPLRPFDSDYKSSDTSNSSGLDTPSRERSDSSKWTERDEKGNLLSGTRSVLNLTSSTLYGIYDSFTPSGNGAQTPLYPQAMTPLHRASFDDQRPPIIGAFERPDRYTLSPPTRHSLVVPFALRTILLFLAGVMYGIVVMQLHDTQRIAPVQVETIERWSPGYLLGWGGVGVLLGALLPWADVFWEDVLGDNKDIFSPHQRAVSKSSTSSQDESRPGSSSGSTGFETNWTPAIRSITAFVGIAFAIRRLPWQSTLQVSLTLALVNPVLWYLFDRSKPGFLLSLIVGVAGTVIALGVNPDIVPSPPTSSPKANPTSLNYDGLFPSDGSVSIERIGVGTWIASVLFCSSLCFGNIGRRLAMVPASQGTGS